MSQMYRDLTPVKSRLSFAIVVKRKPPAIPTSKKPPRTTQELSEHLGLSRATTSYVLNDRWREHNISPQTAEMVLRYAKKTGFRTSKLALALKGDINEDVAILLPPNCFEHHKRAFFELLYRLDQSQKSCTIFQFTAEEFRNAIDHLHTFKVDRTIVLGTPIPRSIEIWRNMFTHVPEARWLFYDFPFEDIAYREFLKHEVCLLGFDREAAHELMFREVRQRGYKQIVVPSYYFEPAYRHRSRMLESMGFEVNPSLSFVIGRNEELVLNSQKQACARDIGRQLLELPAMDQVPVVYLIDDVITSGVIDYVIRHGKRVPDDIAFISWDGLPESRFFQVPHTTLVVPHEQMLEETARWITDAQPRPGVMKFKPFIREGRTLRPNPREAASRDRQLLQAEDIT